MGPSGYGPYHSYQRAPPTTENVVSIQSRTQSIGSDGSLIQRAEHIKIADGRNTQ